MVHTPSQIKNCWAFTRPQSLVISENFRTSLNKNLNWIFFTQQSRESARFCATVIKWIWALFSPANGNLIENNRYSFSLFVVFLCSQLSYCFYEMAPSATQTEHAPTNGGNDPWHQQNGKENHRPPVFFPEDYIAALKKFSKFGSNSGSHKSIYDTIDDVKVEKAAVVAAAKSRTLPLSKNSEYKWV